MARPMSAKPAPSSIAHYHAHVYYDPLKTRDHAERLRARIAEEFPQVKLGRWHDELVGPHTRSMYQVAFPSGLLASFLPWLMLNRDGLTVLLHPETGDELRDHTAHAAGSAASCHCGSMRSSTAMLRHDRAQLEHKCFRSNRLTL